MNSCQKREPVINNKKREQRTLFPLLSFYGIRINVVINFTAYTKPDESGLS